MPDSLVDGKEVEKINIVPGLIISVGPINIPDSQDRPQIVTRNTDGTVSFAQFHRWAEPLDSIIARVINNDLTSLLPQTSFQIFPCNLAIPLDYQIVVEVVQLDSELDKDMNFTAQWSIIEAKTRKLLLTKRSRFVESINPHDYSGLSKALENVCLYLSKEIASNLSVVAKDYIPSKG
jgi:uncharacterized lipoprotein YmbA